MPITGINLIYRLEFNPKKLANYLDIQYKPTLPTSMLVNILKTTVLGLKDNIYVYRLPCCFFDISEYNSNVYLGIEVHSFAYKYNYTGLESDCNSESDYESDPVPNNDPSLIFTIDDKNKITKCFNKLEDYENYYSIRLSTCAKKYVENAINYYLENISNISNNQIIKQTEPKFYALPNGCTACD